MTSGFRLALLCALATPAVARAQSGIDGTLVDGTGGGAGSAERINLLRLEGGLDTVATLTGVEGRFHFDLKAPGPYLIQVQHQGAVYSQMVPPQERGIASVEIMLYESTTDLAAIEVDLPHYIVIVDGPKLHISRVFDIHNRSSPPRTVVGDPGAFRFALPEDAVVTRAAITSARLPLHQEPVETRDGRGSTIAYALKPGLTRFEIEHEIAYPGALDLEETLYHGAATVNAVVLPGEVEVGAEGLVAHGRAERQGVSFLTFTGERLEEGSVLKLAIRGQARAPSPPEPVPPAASATGAPLAGAEPKEVEVGAVRGWRKAGYLVGAVLLLALGVVLALRRPRPRLPASAARRRIAAAADALLDEIAGLDREREAGKLDEGEHRERRAELKRRLVEELRTSRRRKKTA